MKVKIMLAAAITAAVVGGSTGAVLAGYGFEPGGVLGEAVPGDRAKEDGEVRMAALLRLNDSQRSQIKVLMAAERTQAEPLLIKIHELRKILLQLGETGEVSDDGIRTVTSQIAQVESDLMFLRFKTESRVNALLTAEQRDLQKYLRPPAPPRNR